MSTRYRSARRRNNRKTQVAVTAAAAVVAVAGAVIGISLADQHVSSVNQAAFGACLSQASGGASASPSDGSSGAPCPAQSGGANPTAAPSASSGPRVNVAPNTFANGPVATQQLGDIAWQPVDGAGQAINLNQSADQASASGNCTLAVPANPLTAQGLATPYKLGDGCSESNATQQAFVEATILSRNGQVQVYNPLVITQGTRPAVKPVTPKIPFGAEVILDFGFNGTNLVLTGPGAVQRSSGCVDALGQSVIGQVSACNAVPFYNLANAEIARGTLRIPALGTAADGRPCQTTRDFALIDQDQSDNVVSQYLVNGNGQTAQATAANKNAMGGSSPITNGSDDALLGAFVDPANGCTAFTAKDITNPNGTSPSQALNELSARVNQKTQIAVVPPNDEMTLVGGNMSVAKTNTYRSLVDQPLLASNANPTEVAAAYCMNMVNIAPGHDQADMAADANTGSPVPAVGNSLATFLGNRLSMSFANLGCGSYGLTDPVNVTTDGTQVATAVSYNTAQQQATIPAPDTGQGQGTSGQGTAGTGHGNQRPPSRGHGYHWGYHRRYQDPSGE